MLYIFQFIHFYTLESFWYLFVYYWLCLISLNILYRFLCLIKFVAHDLNLER